MSTEIYQAIYLLVIQWLSIRLLLQLRCPA